MRPFSVEESYLFFGREGQSDEVLLKLSKSRFVGVIGPSGSGKSSFIYCGVLPILYGGFLTDSSPNWEVVVTRPGAGPIDNLAESLLKSSNEYSDNDPDEKKIKRTIVSTLLRSSSLGLVEAVQQLRKSENTNYLILVDQFEELFRFKDSNDANSVNETLAFVNLLMEAVNYEDSPIYVAITMRSDFIGDCAQFPELTRKLNDSHYLIPQMTRDQKRKAIEGPVAVGNAKIAPRLTQQLLNDLGDNPDQLPILQHALMRTWNYWSNYRDYEDDVLDLKHYEAIGTMREALSMHANEAYDELDENQKRICEVLFKAITERRGENFGIRRPTRLNEIASIADVSESSVIEVIEKFREPGRSLLTPGYGVPLSSKSMIDITHESLMRIWVRLKNWVDDEADAVQMYLRLAEAANLYQIGKAGLWRPPDLQLALNWLIKHKPTLVWGQRHHPAFERTMVFLEYSKKEFETEQRIKELETKNKLQRARTTAIVFGIITGFALIFLIYAFVQKGIADKNLSEAKRQEKIAKEQTDRATQEAKRANVEAEKAKKAQLEAEKSAEIARQQTILAEIQRQKAEENKAIAEKNEKLAKEKERIAEENKKKADIARQEAEESKKKADIARQDAEAERYKALAKAMALKSKEINDNEQRALVAQQAYNFNLKYSGYDYNNEVYNGLFGALKKYDDPITKSLKGHTSAARALVTSVKNNSIYSGGSDGRVIHWGLSPNGTWVGDSLKKFNNYQIYSIDISKDGSLLVVGGLYPVNRSANFVYLFNLRQPTAEPKKINGFVSNVENLKFTPDGKGFYARSNSGKSIMYSDLNTAREVISSKEKITSIDLNADGTKLSGGGINGNLYVWNVSNNYAANVYPIFPKGKSIVTVCFAPKGDEVILGAENGELHIVNNGVVKRVLTGHASSIAQIKFSNSGKFMATASKDRSVRLWNYEKLKEQPQVLTDHDWVWSMAFSPDDNQIMAGIHSIIQNVPKNNKEDIDYTIHAWPSKISIMANKLCGYIKRNLTTDEWDIYVGDDKPQATCPKLPLNK